MLGLYRNGVLAFARCFIPVWMCALLLFPQPASAHPHVWVDAAIIVHKNSAGRISAIEPVWIFDDLYTQSLLPDLDVDKSGEVDKSELLVFAKEAITNLSEWDYFLHTKVAPGQKVSFKKKINTDATLLNGRFLLRFKLELETPILPDSTLEVKMYDPSYFISIDLISDKEVSFLPAPSGSCDYSVIESPDYESEEKTLSELAFSDEEVAENPDLGAIFAQSVRVTC